MAQDFLAPFELEDNSCFRTTTGGVLIVAPLVCPATQPTSVIWVVAADVVAGDDEISLTHDQASAQYLRKGALLTILDAVGGNLVGTVVVTAETEVASGATGIVPIEPAETAIPTGSTFEFGSNALQLLSPTSLPLSMSSQTEDSTDLTFGVQSSEGVVSISSAIQVAAFDSIQDRALYDIIFKNAAQGTELFAMIARKNGTHTFGRAFASSLENAQEVKSFSKVTFTLNLQAPFVNSPPIRYMDTDEAETLNALRNFLGLSTLTV